MMGMVRSDLTRSDSVPVGVLPASTAKDSDVVRGRRGRRAGFPRLPCLVRTGPLNRQGHGARPRTWRRQ